MASTLIESAEVDRQLVDNQLKPGSTGIVNISTDKLCAAIDSAIEMNITNRKESDLGDATSCTEMNALLPSSGSECNVVLSGKDGAAGVSVEKNLIVEQQAQGTGVSEAKIPAEMAVLMNRSIVGGRFMAAIAKIRAHLCWRDMLMVLLLITTTANLVGMWKLREEQSIDATTDNLLLNQLLKELSSGKDLPHMGINSDEMVVNDTAVSDGVISNKEEPDVILDRITLLTIGVETAGGVMKKLISRNTVIPIKKSWIFTTFADNQSTITIDVYEGERPMTKYNHMLGRLYLTDILPAQRGVPRIEFTLDIDVKGILHVTGEDKDTGSRSSITIFNGQSRLSTEAIERMINDAEKFADDDQNLMARVEMMMKQDMRAVNEA